MKNQKKQKMTSMLKLQLTVWIFRKRIRSKNFLTKSASLTPWLRRQELPHTGTLLIPALLKTGNYLTENSGDNIILQNMERKILQKTEPLYSFRVLSLLRQWKGPQHSGPLMRPYRASAGHWL